MKTIKRLLSTLLGLSISAFIAAGADTGSTDNNPQSSNQPQSSPPTDGIRIAWDYSSLRQLTERGGYPRSIRLQDHSVVAVYENHATGYEMRRSTDEGATWNDPVVLFTPHTVTNDKGSTRVNIANSEIIQLANGDLLIACNYRPQTPEITPFSIAIRRSTDNGATWSPPQVIYEAQPRFTDGCWEPSFLQLPNGDVQVYFANEAPYTHSNEQEISLLTSHDNGATWGDYKTVCFRAGSRDGMPVSKVIGDEIVCAIEDCGFVTFKPYTVRTKLSANWSSPVPADSPQREMALATPVADWIYMGAPYLAVLPTGETLLSYQVDDVKRDDHFGDRVPVSTMEVTIGDSNARNFSRSTRPFPVPTGKHAVWPSVAVWDANTVVALATGNFRGRADAPYFMKGHIMRDLTVGSGEMQEYPLFIGHQGESNLRLGVAKEASRLRIVCKVKDSKPSSDNQKMGSGVCVYLDTRNECINAPVEGVYKISCTYDGKTTVHQGNRGKWENGKLKGLKVASTIVADGYELVFTIPLRSSYNKNAMRIAAALSTSSYTETLVHSDADKPCTWIKMNFTR